MITLLSIGPLVFDLVVNADRILDEGEEDFARPDVIGRRRPFGHAGPGSEGLTISGTLFPERLGGIEAIDVLKTLKSAGVAQLVIRGDGRVMGWYRILGYSADHGHLNARGVGRRIDVEVRLERDEAPEAAAAIGQLLELLG